MSNMSPEDIAIELDRLLKIDEACEQEFNDLIEWAVQFLSDRERYA